MTDAVETMAWTNEVPWHGLGVNVRGDLSPAEMLKSAGLLWRVSREPMFTADGREVPDFAALVRDKDQKVLDVVGSRWQPTQNEEAFEFFNEFVHAGQATMETAGSLRGGRLVWGLANLGATFKLSGGDQVKGYLLMALPHEQGSSIKAKFTTVRVVCQNTMTMAMRRGGSLFTMSHRLVFDPKMQERAKRALGIARDQLDEHKQHCELLAKTTIARSDAEEFLVEMIDPELWADGLSVVRDKINSRKLGRKAQTAIDALDHAPGSQLKSAKGTMWGAVNALTYATDHLWGKGADQRLTKAWFGPAANLKERVLVEAVKRSS